MADEPDDQQPEPINLDALRRERGPVTDHVLEFDGERFTIPGRENWPAATIGLVMEGRFEEAFVLAMGPVDYERLRVKAGLTIGDLGDLLNALNERESGSLGKSRPPAGSPRRTGRR